MINRKRQFGISLPEMTVVIAIAALMLALTIPAINMLLNSFESESGAKSIISSALASARAMAAKEQRYAGVRFQKRLDPNNPDPLKASQYIIFIVQDPNIMAFGFKAVDGIQPIKLPDSIGVMDLFYHPNLFTPDGRVDTDPEIANANVFMDTSTFSIVFSPAGKLVVHDVRIRNRNGEGDYASYTNYSMDDIFNKKAKVDAGLAMFYQDDYFGDNAYPNIGLGLEPSRSSFIIYETKVLNQTNPNRRWTDYLQRLSLNPVYINPYTGTIVNDK